MRIISVMIFQKGVELGMSWLGEGLKVQPVIDLLTHGRRCALETGMTLGRKHGFRGRSAVLRGVGFTELRSHHTVWSYKVVEQKQHSKHFTLVLTTDWGEGGWGAYS